MLVASWFAGMFLNTILYCLLFCKFTDVEKFKINYKVLLLSFVCGIIYSIISLDSKLNYIRPYITHLVTYIGFLILYRYDFLKTLIAELCIFIIISISEIIYGIVIIFILNINAKVFVETVFGYLTTNIIICFIAFVLSNITFLKRIFVNITNWYNKNNNYINMIFIMFCMGIFTFFLYNNYIGVLPRELLLVTNIFSFGVIFFVINFFKEKSNNIRIINEYDQLLNYVQKYEILMEDKSKKQHEYKNQLALLKSLINKKNIKALKYIDDLSNDFKDNNDIFLLTKLKHLPSGGLKGLIYYKIEEMKEKNVKVFINISSEIEKYSFDDKINKNLKDISKVIGVYIDNAIEACVESKEKYIVLEVYLEDDQWVFSISNTYSNNFNISMVEMAGYTTKGNGKGYGLSLVKDILNNNKILFSKKELNGIYYVQKLYIKNRVA